MATATDIATDIDSGDRLSFTIFLAAAVHAIIIFGVTFTIDSGNKIAPTLNITLATHDAKSPPDKADFLAQHNQQASGTAADVRELTVKDRAELADTRIRDISPSPQQKSSEEKKLDKKQILVSERASKNKIHNETQTEKSNELSEKREGKEFDAPLINPEFASLQAKLDKLKQDLAKQPRIRRLTSVSTKASYDAEYLNAWAQKVEQVGNQNFPETALKNEIFGSLRLSVLLHPNGTVEDIEILQSSGHGILDEAAVHIVRLASPFRSFPKEIRKKADKLEIIRTWRFEITGLKTTR